MYCLETAKWRLGKGSVLGWGLFFCFVFLISSCVFLFVVFLIEKGNKKLIKKKKKEHLKKHFPDLKHYIYFSGGAPNQYKYFKIFTFSQP